jgi:hypothetical protein
MMSSNLENDGLICLQNDDLNRNSLAMVIPGPRRAKNSRDDVDMPPLLPRRKSSRRTVSKGIDLVATMQSSSPACLCVVITDGSWSSPSSSLLVSSSKVGDDREDGADSVTAAAFTAECDDNDDDIGLISSSVGSLERCLHTINTSLCLWSPESRNFLSEFAKNIKEGDTIYWVQGLCPNREKSLALGKRGLGGLDHASCPSANFNDRVLEPVAERLRAKMVYCNIRDECIRDGENRMCATAEEAKRLAEVIGVFAELVHQKEAKFIFQNCSGKSITTTLIPKIKKVELSTPTITFVNEDLYHLSFYGYQCNRCFFTRELQEYRIYLDLQNMYEDLRKAVGDDQMSFSFDELLNWARSLVMVVDHRNKTHETMEVLQTEWTAKGLVKIAPLHRSFEIKRLKEKLEMLTEASDDTAEQKKDLEMKITRLESETLEERTQRKKEEDMKKEEAATVAKAERDRKRAEKEAEEEAQRVAKAAERDAKWSAVVDASIESMLDGGVLSFSKIASKLGNGLKTQDITNRWYNHLKESSGITKPAVQPGFLRRITWTEDVDATIVRMRTDGESFPKIASELGNGLASHAIMNRWNRHLKDKLM